MFECGRIKLIFCELFDCPSKKLVMHSTEKIIDGAEQNLHS